MSNDDSTKNNDSEKNSGITRRDFMKYSAGTVACISLGSLTYGCGGNSSGAQVAGYPIDSVVATTDQRMLSFPYSLSTGTPNVMPTGTEIAKSPNGGPGLAWNELKKIVTIQHPNALANPKC